MKWLTVVVSFLGLQMLTNADMFETSNKIATRIIYIVYLLFSSLTKSKEHNEIICNSIYGYFTGNTGKLGMGDNASIVDTGAWAINEANS